MSEFKTSQSYREALFQNKKTHLLKKVVQRGMCWATGQKMAPEVARTVYCFHPRVEIGVRRKRFWLSQRREMALEGNRHT